MPCRSNGVRRSGRGTPRREGIAQVLRNAEVGDLARLAERRGEARRTQAVTSGELGSNGGDGEKTSGKEVVDAASQCITMQWFSSHRSY